MKGFPGADHKGYTFDQGGRSQAEQDYKSRTKDAPSRQVGADSQSRVTAQSMKISAAGQFPFTKVHTSNSTRKNQRPETWEDGLETPCKYPRVWESDLKGLNHSFDTPGTGYQHGLPASFSSDSDVSTEEYSSGSDRNIKKEDSPIQGSGIDTDIACTSTVPTTLSHAIPNQIASKKLLSGKDDNDISKASANEHEPRPGLRIKKEFDGIFSNKISDRSVVPRFHNSAHEVKAFTTPDHSDYGDFPEDLSSLASEGPSHSARELPLVPQDGLETNTKWQGPDLSDEQHRLVNLILQGKNVFFTGSAGTGKSTTMKYIIWKMKGQRKNLSVIAPTGRAALAIGGTTLMTYAGWNPDSLKRPLKILKERAHGNIVWKRLGRTEVLIIDEISMVENLVLERLNEVMKSAKTNKQPFGGAQIIVAGDFCQLPPVIPFRYCINCGGTLMKKWESQSLYHECECGLSFPDTDKWAFRSSAWHECDFIHVNLSKIHRQKEPVLMSILQKCRFGWSLSSQEQAILLHHRSDIERAVELFPTREQVARVNSAAFALLEGPIYEYEAIDDFSWYKKRHPELEYLSSRDLEDGSLLELAGHSFDYRIELRKDMPVILLASTQSGLVSGSQGIVIDFEDDQLKIELPKLGRDHKK